MRRIKKSKRKKKISQIIHAKRRAWERYDVNLSQRDVAVIIRAIRSNDPSKAQFFMKQSNRVSIYIVNWGGNMIPFVYDKIRKSIVTALPQEAIERYAML